MRPVLQSIPTPHEEENARKRRIAEIVSPTLALHSFSLVEIHESRQRMRYQIRLTLYRAGGMPISDLEAIHRIVYPQLTLMLNDRDVALELSTPGIDYVFRHDNDYDIFRGQPVRLLSKIDQQWHLGVLIGLENSTILLRGVNDELQRHDQHKVMKVELNGGQAK